MPVSGKHTGTFYPMDARSRGLLWSWYPKPEDEQEDAFDEQWCKTYFDSFPKSLVCLESAHPSVEGEATSKDPGMQAVLRRARDLKAQRAAKEQELDPSSAPFFHWENVQMPLDPLEDDQQWERIEHLAPAWFGHQTALKQLGVIKSLQEPDGALCIRTASLPHKIRRAIESTGLLPGTEATVPIIPIITSMDPKIFDACDLDAEIVLSAGLPSLRMLRSLQHRIAPARKTVLQTATIFVNLQYIVVFIHTMVPGSKVRSSMVTEAILTEEIAILRLVRLLKTIILDAFLLSLDTSMAPPEAHTGAEYINDDIWATQSGDDSAGDQSTDSFKSTSTNATASSQSPNRRPNHLSLESEVDATVATTISTKNLP
ncbi:hypothetical protein OC834_005700 [Tilletia horrida]|nr:hypothetical protein OC834_005700 [Tilletia horrida]